MLAASLCCESEKYVSEWCIFAVLARTRINATNTAFSGNNSTINGAGTGTLRYS